MARYEHIKIFQLCYALTLKIYKVTSNFKKEYKYTLGEKLKLTCHEILDFVVEANNKADKRESISKLDSKIESLRIFLRMAVDLNIAGVNTLKEINEILMQIGEQVGGWQRWADKNCESTPARVSATPKTGSERAQ